MTLARTDFSILDKFAFEVPPVGVKFMADPPEGLERLGEKMALCEMLKKAQEGKAFFADQDSHTCEAGLHVLGQADASGPFVSGKFGAGLGHGMKRRKLFAEGKQLVVIPFDLLPSMLQTLQEMEWVLPAYKPDGMEFVGRLLTDLGIAPPKKT